MSKYLILLLAAAGCYGQTGYVAQKTTTLSASAEVITVQQPATGSKLVEFKSAYVDCAAACVVTLERNGANTPASTTTLVPRNLNPNESAATATAFSASNVGTGTVLNVVSLAAGSYMVFDLTGIYLPANTNIGSNFTIRTSSITGDVHITIKWTER